MKKIFIKRACLMLGCLLCLVPFTPLEAQTDFDYIPGEYGLGSLGGSTYTIPIECPEGINGMQPQLSLVFNSQSGEGSCGLNWSLGGISAISRVPATIFSDSQVSGITFTGSDCYALDGNRLIIHPDGNRYVTETETWQLIEPVGQLMENGVYLGPQWFRVTTKDGRVMEYGNTPSSRYIPQRDRNSSPYMWLLSRVEDPNGNYIWYSYDSSSGNVKLSEISYGNIRSPNDHRLFISANKRKDNKISRIAGKAIVNDFVYSDIYMTTDGNPVHNYHLTYRIYINNAGKEEYRLVQVDKKIGGAAVSPTILVWKDNEYQLKDKGYHVNFSYSDRNLWDFSFIANDINGDGKDELLALQTYNNTTYLEPLYPRVNDNGETWYGPASKIFNLGTSVSFDAKGNNAFHNKGMSLGDLNGDGIKEFVTIYEMKVSGRLNVQFRICDKDNMYVHTLPMTTTQSAPPYVCADFNNDGRDEVLFIEDMPKNGLYPGRVLYFSKGLLKDIPYVESYFNVDVPDAPRIIYAADFDNDGLADILAVTEKDCYFFKNEGGVKDSSGKVKVSFTRVNLSGNIHFTSVFSVIRCGDFNGDGLTDFLLNEPCVPVWYLAINNGNFGFDRIDLPHFTAAEEGNSKGNSAREDCIVFDFNHDGLSDVVLLDAIYSKDDYQKTKLSWYKSVGDNLEKFRETEFRSVDYAFGGLNCAADLDGDGRQELFSYHSDLYAYTPDGYSHVISCPDPSFKQDKLTSIIEGSGKGFSFEYRPLSLSRLEDGSNFYTKQTAYSPYVYYAQPPLFCLRRCTVSDGARSYSDTYYSYSDLAIGSEGKGVHGFGSVTAADHVTQRQGVTTVQWDAAWIYPRVTTQRNSTLWGKGLSEQVNISNMQHGVNYIINPFTEKHTDLIVGWSSNVRYAGYDEAGNPTDIITTYGSLSHRSVLEYIRRGSWCKNKVSTQAITKKQGDDEYARYTSFSYDEKGNLIRENRDPADVNSLVTEYGDFNMYGLPQKITVTGNGITRTSTTAYTASGRFPASVTDELGQTTTYEWAETTGLLRTRTDASGTTLYYYDGFRRLRKTAYPSGLIEEAGLYRAASGAPSYAAYYSYSHTHGQSPVTTWYDCMGRELESEQNGFDSEPVFIQKEYNEKGELYRTCAPHYAYESPQWTTYTYDEYGRPVRVDTPLGTDTYTYDLNTTTLVSRSIGTKSTTVNIFGDPICEVTNGKKVDYVYNAAGLLSSATPEGGLPLTLSYNVQGNRTRIKDPDAGIIYSTYDAFGQLTKESQRIHLSLSPVSSSSSQEETQTFEDNEVSPQWAHPSDPALMETRYEYTPEGLLKKISQAPSRYSSYTYDSRNRISSIMTMLDSEFVNQTYSYDNYDRLLQETKYVGGKSFRVLLDYDDYGRIIKKTYPSLFCVSYGYDDNGYLTKVLGDKVILKSVGEYTPQILINRRNGKGQLLMISKGNKTTTYTYNPVLNLPTRIYTAGVTDMRYGYTTRGFLSSRTDYLNWQQESFTYDTQRRLLTWTPKRMNGSASAPYSISYDASTGNITSKSNVGDGAFEYWGPLSQIHSLRYINGKSSSIPSSPQTIQYTDFKKLKKITDGWNTLSLSYGADQERAMQVETNLTGKLTRYYMGDYEEESDQDGNIRLIHYIWAGEDLAGVYIIHLYPGEMVSRQENEFYYAFTDSQGSLLALCSADGVVREKYAYDPWGMRRNPFDWTQLDIRKTFLVSRGYTFHEHLDSFGLINMNGRVYDPLLGMFLSPDPYIQEGGNWLNYNRYSYCLNNPLSYIDPSGEMVWLAAAIFGVGGVVNLVYNLVDGNVGNFWQGLAYFGTGGVSSLAGFYVNPLLGGMILGASNNLLTQGFSNGFGNIDYFQAMGAGIASGITVGVGDKLGSLLSKPLSKLTSTIASPVVKGALEKGLTYSATNFIVNTSFSLGRGEDIRDALKSGGRGSLQGFGMGIIFGGIGGYNYSQEKNLNPWTGVAKETQNQMGHYGVYQGVDENNDVRYVGITSRDPQKRFQEHLNSGTKRANLQYDLISNTGNLTLEQARIIEQNLINKYGLEKNGGQLFNKINSIAPKKWKQYGIK